LETSQRDARIGEIVALLTISTLRNLAGESSTINGVIVKNMATSLKSVARKPAISVQLLHHLPPNARTVLDAYKINQAGLKVRHAVTLKSIVEAQDGVQT